MSLSLDTIKEAMEKAEELTPQQVVNYRTYLAAINATKLAQLSGILSFKPGIWLKIRENKKSDTAAEREWDATTRGIQEMQLRIEIKAIEKLFNALGSKLRLMEHEARNQM